jgi:hypothetical protein
MGEAVSTAHQALSQAQCILHHEGEDFADEHRYLQLWANMLKRTTVSVRAAARADSMVSTYRWRTSRSVMLTPDGPFLMRRRCTHRPRLRPVPSPSMRRTLLCVHATNPTHYYRHWAIQCSTSQGGEQGVGQRSPPSGPPATNPIASEERSTYA